MDDVPLHYPSPSQQNDNRMTWMLHTTQDTSTNYIVSQLHQNIPLKAVSDGSFHPIIKVGTAAWTIQATDPSLSISGNNVVPGNNQIQCSHRSELSGLIGIV